MSIASIVLEVVSSLGIQVSQPAAANEAAPTAAKSAVVATPILSKLAQPAFHSAQSLPTSSGNPSTSSNHGQPTSSGNPSTSSSHGQPTYEALKVEIARLKVSLEQQLKERQEDQKAANLANLRLQEQSKERLVIIESLAVGLAGGCKAPEDDNPLSYLKKLSTAQKVWLVGSLVAYGYLTSPAQVAAAAPRAQASLLSRIGLTPTNVAIVAVAAVAYNVLKPKVEALTSVYTTWQPRVEAAKKWFNWFSS